MIEVRQELGNVGTQHRVDLLNNEPGDSGDETMAGTLADFNLAVVDRHAHELRGIEAALRRIRMTHMASVATAAPPSDLPACTAYPTTKRCIVCQKTHERGYAQTGTRACNTAQLASE